MLLYEGKEFRFVSLYLLVTVGFGALVIYPKEFVFFKFRGANFLLPKSSHRCQNQPVL